jgi:nucleoid-associated protein YgaU
LNPLSKPTIQSSLEAEELIAPVEVATELQGIDAVPISKSADPTDGAGGRDAGGSGALSGLDPVQAQAKVGSTGPVAAGSGVAQGKGLSGARGAKGIGKNSAGDDAAARTGGRQNQNASSGGAQAGGAPAGGSVWNGKNLNSTPSQGPGAGGTGVVGGTDASAETASGKVAGGKDAVLMGSRDPASAQSLQADGSPVQAGLSGAARGPASADGAQIIDYRVKEGDTLMKIAFEVFGDLTRWREILELNQEVIHDPNVLTKGSRLRIKVFGVRTVSRNGEAYLIKRGDTLQKISLWVYGTLNKWKKLWDNNRELIRDPNKIFAGFKLYFVREQDPKRIPAATDPAVPVKNDSSH